MKYNKIGTCLVFLSFFFITIFGFTNSVTATNWNNYDYFDVTVLDTLASADFEPYDFVDLGYIGGLSQFAAIGENASGYVWLKTYSYDNDDLELIDELAFTDAVCYDPTNVYGYDRLRYSNNGIYAFGSHQNNNPSSQIDNYTYVAYSGMSLGAQMTFQCGSNVVSVDSYSPNRNIISTYDSGLIIQDMNQNTISSYDNTDFTYSKGSIGYIGYKEYYFVSIDSSDDTEDGIYVFDITDHTFDLVDFFAFENAIDNMFFFKDTIGFEFGPMAPAAISDYYITARFDHEVGGISIDDVHMVTFKFDDYNEELSYYCLNSYEEYYVDNFYISDSQDTMVYASNTNIYIKKWQNEMGWVTFYDNCSVNTEENFCGITSDNGYVVVFDDSNNINLLKLDYIDNVDNQEVNPDDDEYYIEIFKSGTLDKPIGENWIDIYWQGLNGSNYWIALNHDSIPYIRGFQATGEIQVIKNDFYWDGINDLQFELINHTTFEVYATYNLNADYWSDDDNDGIPNGEDNAPGGGGYDNATTDDSIDLLIGIGLCLIIGTFAAFMGAGAIGWIGGFFGTMIIVSRPQLGFLYMIPESVGILVLVVGILIAFILFMSNR